MIRLTRTTRVYYAVEPSREEAIQLLQDREIEVPADASDLWLADKLVEVAKSDDDALADELDDESWETDSGTDPWEVN